MEEIRIRNYMEDLVEDMMPRILDHLNICQCKRCWMDILANVLNQLPPKYVVTRKGQLYTKLSSLQHQFDVDIIAAITRAATIIGANPRHEDEQ
jgi:competence protein ComFB